MSLDLVDYLSFLVDDPQTKVITVMAEGVRRPDEFMAVAAQALEKNKPILVVKSGRTAEGAVASCSLAELPADYEALLRAIGQPVGFVSDGQPLSREDWWLARIHEGGLLRDARASVLGAYPDLARGSEAEAAIGTHTSDASPMSSITRSRVIRPRPNTCRTSPMPTSTWTKSTSL